MKEQDYVALCVNKNVCRVGHIQDRGKGDVKDTERKIFVVLFYYF